MQPLAMVYVSRGCGPCLGQGGLGCCGVGAARAAACVWATLCVLFWSFFHGDSLRGPDVAGCVGAARPAGEMDGWMPAHPWRGCTAFFRCSFFFLLLREFRVAREGVGGGGGGGRRAEGGRVRSAAAPGRAAAAHASRRNDFFKPRHGRGRVVASAGWRWRTRGRTAPAAQGGHATRTADSSREEARTAKKNKNTKKHSPSKGRASGKPTRRPSQEAQGRARRLPGWRCHGWRAVGASATTTGHARVSRSVRVVRIKVPPPRNLPLHARGGGREGTHRGVAAANGQKTWAQSWTQ